MYWSSMHASVLAQAFGTILGRSESGSVAFVRCLASDVVLALVRDAQFTVKDWAIWRVADTAGQRTITADQAVAIREEKQQAALLLVDTALAGAGMDGIYSAAREISEKNIFDAAHRLALGKITAEYRQYAQSAIKQASRHGYRLQATAWTKLDFLCRIAETGQHPGAYLPLLGLWPVKGDDPDAYAKELVVSGMFIDRLLGPHTINQPSRSRMAALRLLDPSPKQEKDLKIFLAAAATQPLLPALARLADQTHLWINELHIEESAQEIQGIELVPWHTKSGRLTKWSGLQGDDADDSIPILNLPLDSTRAGGSAGRLEIRWKSKPAVLPKGSVEYGVAIVTDSDVLVSKSRLHAETSVEKIVFSNDDFELEEDTVVYARAVVAVTGKPDIPLQESEEFRIRFGEMQESEQSGSGQIVQTFSEGIIELGDRSRVSEIADTIVANRPFPANNLKEDGKGFVSLHIPQSAKRFRVHQSPLVQQLTRLWQKHNGALGRWCLKVSDAGLLVEDPSFVHFAAYSSSPLQEMWDRAVVASQKMAELHAAIGGVGQIYDENVPALSHILKEYLLAWVNLLDRGAPELALANTVEVQSRSGKTLGLIVLPSHPLRVAWLAAYDNLVFHAAFDQGVTPQDIRHEFKRLDGFLFPPMLPVPEASDVPSGSSFVFADTLGFHTVGMVLDSDLEPKATTAILARMLGDSTVEEAAPTLGSKSANVLGDEIKKYLGCHYDANPLHMHALRAGDGMTVVRALGQVEDRTGEETEDDAAEVSERQAFVLELYPSAAQREVAGRFIAEAQQKRRTGAGSVSPEDRWMLESLGLPGGVNMPQLRWARKEVPEPDRAAHLAVGFNTFQSSVTAEAEPNVRSSFHAFGLLSFFDREFMHNPAVLRSTLPVADQGESHPDSPKHTDRLMKLQRAIQKLVARNIGTEGAWPVLKTEIPPAQQNSLQQLHRLSDWVITLDRNAGIEFFDSPRDDKKTYDAYVIDCVPEREDLGCLQMITSTSNLDEMCDLVGGALDQMGLRRSSDNAQFLIESLKALSGRLAIRLTGYHLASTSELIALALAYAHCRAAPSSDNECWLSLEKGYLVPVDDIPDLLPPADYTTGTNNRIRRPDFIHVSATRRGLCFRFIEVKYRRHLGTVSAPELLSSIRDQVENLHTRWHAHYGPEEKRQVIRAIRCARLARVLRFYADKARRHYLSAEQHQSIVKEIDRMIEKGQDYKFAQSPEGNRGWIFCPEYNREGPNRISPHGWDVQIFLFGPGLLPRLNTGTAISVSQPEPEEPPDVRGPALPTPAAEPQVCLGHDAITDDAVTWPVMLKANPHLLLAGLPGMGKTTCLLNLCHQLVAAGIRPIVFSYHHDIDAKLEGLSTIHYIDCDGMSFNPLRVWDRSSSKAHLDVAGALRDIFAAIFPDLGDLQSERIRTAVKQSFEELGWGNAQADSAILEEPKFRRFVEILRTESRPDRRLLARLDELDDYDFFVLREAHLNLWEIDHPIVIRIHGTQNENLQKAFAALVFYGLYKDMFRRGLQDRITHAVIFDEAHRASGLKLVPTMAKECRKYGISLILASQEARDFNVSLFSAIANYLMLRLTETDAKSLVRNVAGARQERDLTDKVKQMARFKALYFQEGKDRPVEVNLLPEIRPDHA